MRLTGQSTPRANSRTSDPCPCCGGSVEGLKRAMSEVSRALADPLPPSIRGRVEPALDAVRLAGRDVMVGLRGAFGRSLTKPDLATFGAAVAGLDGIVKARSAGLPAGERDGLEGIRDALGRLCDALTTLGMDLDDADYKAWLRAGPGLICLSVGDQRGPARGKIMSGRRERPTVADAASDAQVALTVQGVAG